MPEIYQMASQLDSFQTDAKMSSTQVRNTHCSLIPVLGTAATSDCEYDIVLFYKRNIYQQLLLIFLSVATLGLIYIPILWFPQLSTKLRKQQVKDVADGADCVLIHNGKTHYDWEEAELFTLDTPGETSATSAILYWFQYRSARYFYDAETGKFSCLKCELKEKWCDVLKRVSTLDTSRASPTVKTGAGASGWSQIQVSKLLAIYGTNELHLTYELLQSIILRKILHPFYLVQAAGIIIWLYEGYTLYALVILMGSILFTIRQIYFQFTRTQNVLIKHDKNSSIRVIRDHKVQSIEITDMVIGDLVIIEEGIVPADIVLVKGECLIDESTLTGEVVPITKQAVSFPDSRNNLSIDTDLGALTKAHIADADLRVTAKGSFLYAGSTVLESKADFSTRGIVVCTAAATYKGELFKAAHYGDKRQYINIHRDSYAFLFALLCVAILAIIKRLVQASRFGLSASEAIMVALDALTIAIPPALPVILTFALTFAQSRLESIGVTCIDAERITIAGHVDTCCFDKTGTLSYDHLDFQGVDECSLGSSTNAHGGTLRASSASKEGVPSFIGLQNEVEVLSVTSIVGLATCHGLTERNGIVLGSSLEKDMFKATGYTIEKNKKNAANTPFSILVASPIGKTYGIVKSYMFDATLQRSSVLIEDFETGQRAVYAKGSPEGILNICNPNTIPANYQEKIKTYSFQGYHVLAMATKSYPVTQDTPVREAMDCRLNFLGFVVFLNKIKTESPYVVSTLEDANIGVRILTGDNAFTAIHVARKVNMDLQTNILLLDVIHKATNANVVGALPSVKSRLVYADIDDLTLSRDGVEWSDLEPKSFLVLAENNDIAVSGPALELLISRFEESDVDFVEKIILNAKIFARVLPHQKTWIVHTLMKSGKCVCMVGDGINDCGALKAAHVGFAISDTDVPVFSPFTTKQKRITDLIDLLREGRCALSSSYITFKYMILYAVIQITLISMMNDRDTQMSGGQFLFDDLILVLSLSMVMVRAKSLDTLSPNTPAKSLFAPTVMVSLAGQLMLFFCCVGIAISSASTKDWFCSASEASKLTRTVDAALEANKFHHKAEAIASLIHPPCYLFEPGNPAYFTTHSYENSVLWLFGHTQYWIVAFAMNVKDLYRKPFYRNQTFLVVLVSTFIVLQVQLFSYKNELTSQTVRMDTSFGVLALPASYCTSLFFLGLFDLFLAAVWEYVFVGLLVHHVEQRRQRAADSRNASWQYAGRRGKIGYLRALFGRNAYSSGKGTLVADHDSLLAEFENKSKTGPSFNDPTSRKAAGQNGLDGHSRKAGSVTESNLRANEEGDEVDIQIWA